MSAADAPDTNFHTLYSDHHGWLRNWLRRRVDCSEQAADLAHDTFLRILGREHRNDYREPKAFLTTIARGLLIDHWRRQDIERAWCETLQILSDPLAPSPEETALFLDALCRIDRLLDQLKPKVREAFLLSQLDGLTYREIGDRLCVGERMVKKYMAQAMVHCLLLDDAC